jgi:hypothetical protein
MMAPASSRSSFQEHGKVGVYFEAAGDNYCARFTRTGCLNIAARTPHRQRNPRTTLILRRRGREFVRGNPRVAMSIL